MSLYANVEEFRAESIQIGEKNNYCDESKEFIKNAKTFEELLEVGKRWFPTSFETGWLSKEVLGKVNPILRKRALIFLNTDFDTGHGLITEGNHKVGGDAHVFVTGDAKVDLSDNAKAHVFGSADCIVIGTDRAKIISNGEESIAVTDYVFVRRNGNSKVIANGNSVVYSKNKGEITLLGSSVFKLAKK